MNIQLTDIIDDPTRVGEVPPEEIPDLLGVLETLKARLWCRLNTSPDPVTQTSPMDGERLITVEQAAELLAFTEQYVYDLIKKGGLPAIRHGKYIRIKLSDLQAWIDEHREISVDNNVYKLYSNNSGRKRTSKNQKITRSNTGRNGRTDRRKLQHSGSLGTGRGGDIRAHFKVHSSAGPNEDETEGEN